MLIREDRSLFHPAPFKHGPVYIFSDSELKSTLKSLVLFYLCKVSGILGHWGARGDIRGCGARGDLKGCGATYPGLDIEAVQQ